MNVARSGTDGFWWHVAENPSNGLGGIYLRVGQQDGVIIPRDEAVALLEGLAGVLDGNRTAE